MLRDNPNRGDTQSQILKNLDPSVHFPGCELCTEVWYTHRGVHNLWQNMPTKLSNMNHSFPWEKCPLFYLFCVIYLRLFVSFYLILLIYILLLFSSLTVSSSLIQSCIKFFLEADGWKKNLIAWINPLGKKSWGYNDGNSAVSEERWL